MKAENEMRELLGCETTEEIIEWFQEMNPEQIEAELNRCWPHEEGNREFAEEVKEFVEYHSNR